MVANVISSNSGQLPMQDSVSSGLQMSSMIQADNLNLSESQCRQLISMLQKNLTLSNSSTNPTMTVESQHSATHTYAN